MERAGGGNKKRERSEREAMEIKNDRDCKSERGGGATEGISSRARQTRFLFLALSLYFSPLHTKGTLPDIQ